MSESPLFGKLIPSPALMTTCSIWKHGEITFCEKSQATTCFLSNNSSWVWQIVQSYLFNSHVNECGMNVTSGSDSGMDCSERCSCGLEHLSIPKMTYTVVGAPEDRARWDAIFSGWYILVTRKRSRIRVKMPNSFFYDVFLTVCFQIRLYCDSMIHILFVGCIKPSVIQQWMHIQWRVDSWHSSLQELRVQATL